MGRMLSAVGRGLGEYFFGTESSTFYRYHLGRVGEFLEERDRNRLDRQRRTIRKMGLSYLAIGKLVPDAVTGFSLSLAAIGSVGFSDPKHIYACLGAAAVSELFRNVWAGFNRIDKNHVRGMLRQNKEMHKTRNQIEEKCAGDCGYWDVWAQRADLN